MAGAIAPATVPRRSLASRGPKPPASARPAHGGRFAPAGSGAGFRCAWGTGPVETWPLAGRGNAVRFLVPPGEAFVGCTFREGSGDWASEDVPVNPCRGRGHRPCHSATPILCQPGAKAPGQRPPRPRRALRTRRVGRWPSLCLGEPVLWKRGLFPGGETRCVSWSRPDRGSLSLDQRDFPVLSAVRRGRDCTYDMCEMVRRCAPRGQPGLRWHKAAAFRGRGRGS
jgi:hypothetical protein